jgi:hypothetical protein
MPGDAGGIDRGVNGGWVATDPLTAKVRIMGSFPVDSGRPARFPAAGQKNL